MYLSMLLCGKLLYVYFIWSSTYNYSLNLTLGPYSYFLYHHPDRYVSSFFYYSSKAGDCVMVNLNTIIEQNMVSPSYEGPPVRSFDTV